MKNISLNKISQKLILWSHILSNVCIQSQSNSPCKTCQCGDVVVSAGGYLGLAARCLALSLGICHWPLYQVICLAHEENNANQSGDTQGGKEMRQLSEFWLCCKESFVLCGLWAKNQKSWQNLNEWQENKFSPVPQNTCAYIHWFWFWLLEMWLPFLFLPIYLSVKNAETEYKSGFDFFYNCAFERR